MDCGAARWGSCVAASLSALDSVDNLLVPCCVQAATVEVGTNLVQTVTAAGGKGGSDQGKQQGSNLPEPLKMVGGIGMELLRVRGAQHWGFNRGVAFDCCNISVLQS
jgi:hypothetical protein